MDPKLNEKYKNLQLNTMVELWGSEDGDLIVKLCFAEPAATQEKYKNVLTALGLKFCAQICYRHRP